MSISLFNYVFIVLFLICAGLAYIHAEPLAGTTNKCVYYNRTQCLKSKDKSGCGEGVEECKSSVREEAERPSTLCYALWQNSSTTGFVLKFKGCWVGSRHSCVDKSRCIENREEAKKHMFFCCCDGDHCNQDIYHHPKPNELVMETTTAFPPPTDQPLQTTIMFVFAPLIMVCCFIIAGFWVYRYRKLSHFKELPTRDPSNIPNPPSPYVGHRPIQLIEVKAQGRFGAVWKAKIGHGHYRDEYVAVKVFPLQDRASWQVEQEVYRLPQMSSPHILRFLGAEKRNEGINSEYWLVSEYHHHGSLSDFLKANVVNWPQLIKIAIGIARGLTFLHEELPENKLEKYKPSIAHRDFKSKNVLLKNDMEACVADFGLALIFQPGQTPGDVHGQVGTRRYMAPEVLEGAINFSRDAFLRIDMYACGLVLWELLTRCTVQDEPVDEYRLPFEEEVGQYPTLEDMQEAVAQQKKRPLIKDSWRKNADINSLCETIEDLWDHDAEARLSACCVVERLDSLTKQVKIYNTITQIENAVLTPMI